MSDFLNEDELSDKGFAALGPDVSISRNALFIAPERITIGAHSRIDAFSVVSAGPGGIALGRNVHLSAFCTVLGRGTVNIGDFCTVSVRCSIFSSNDDYSGRSMTNPTVPDEYRESQDGVVALGAHSIVGAGSIILPEVTIGQSAAIGALSLVKDDVPDFAVAAGTPARVIATRERGHLELARAYLGAE